MVRDLFSRKMRRNIVKSLEQKVENQVQFWSLLGPFLLLITIAVLLFKLSAHWYFPVSAMIGIPLCLKWKLKGLAAALSCLFALSLISYQNLELDQRYWHVGMAIAMAFSFIILTLSLEEVESLVGKMQRESQSRLDNFLLLDETTKRAEEAWAEERSALTVQLATIAQELTQVQEDKQVFYKLAQLAKDELLQMRTQQELLQHDLLYKKQQISQLNEKLEDTEITLQEMINSDSEQKIIQISDNLEHSLQRQTILESQLERSQKQLENVIQEKEEFVSQLKVQQERLEEKSDAFARLHLEKERLLESLKQLQNQLQVLDKEKEQLQETFTALRLQYEKVLHSEINCKQSLQDQVNLADELESKLKQIEKELAFLKVTKLRLETQLSQSELDGQQKIEMLQVSLAQSNQDLASKNEALIKTDVTIKKLLIELENQRQEVKNLFSTNEQMNNFQEHLEKELENKKIEVIELQNHIAKLERSREEMPLVDSNTRGIECMYVQLKNQFQEKSSVLDQTRRELFMAQEKVMYLQKMQEELEVYSQTETESLLLSELKRLICEYDKMQSDYECEIEVMQELVSKLIQKK